MADIVCFDVCGTLYRGQTTHDFCRYVRRNIPKATGYYFDIIFVLGRILGKLRARQLAHRICTFASIQSIRGLQKHELHKMAQDFWSDRLVNQLITSVVNLLEGYRRRGDHLLLLSAAIEPPIRALAEHFKIDFVCSSLHYNKENRVTGLQKDLLGHKENALRSYLTERSLKGQIIFFSDNLNDLLFLAKVHRGVFVSHKPSIGARVKEKFPNLEIISI